MTADPSGGVVNVQSNQRGFSMQVASVVRPFRFTGLVGFPADDKQPSEALTGHGFVQVNLAWWAEFEAWKFTDARYEFSARPDGSDPAATPEPATLLLVAPFAAQLLRRSLMTKHVRDRWADLLRDSSR